MDTSFSYVLCQQAVLKEATALGSCDRLTGGTSFTMSQGREQLDMHVGTRLGNRYVLTQMQQKQQNHIHQLTEQLQSRLNCRLPYQTRNCFADTTLHQSATTAHCSLVLDERCVVETVRSLCRTEHKNVVKSVQWKLYLSSCLQRGLCRCPQK